MGLKRVTSHLHPMVGVEVDAGHHGCKLPSGFSSQSCIAWSKPFVVIIGCVAAILLMVCIFTSMASPVGAWARWMAVFFGSDLSLLPL